MTSCRCHNPLDNVWAIEQAQSWTPLEVSPPALDDMDPADTVLGLSQPFSNADAEEASSCTSSDAAVDIPTAAAPLPSTSPPQDSVSPRDSSGMAVVLPSLQFSPILEIFNGSEAHCFLFLSHT